MRQKDDAEFAQPLNRVRTGEHSSHDFAILKSRQPDEHNYPYDALHIFPYNKDVDEYNNKMLNELGNEIYMFNAVDAKKDSETGQVDSNAKCSDKMSVLPIKLQIAVGARIVLLRNVLVEDGLVNSAQGIVTGFLPEPQMNECNESFDPKYVMVDFKDENIGKKTRKSFRNILKNSRSTPIAKYEESVQLKKGSKASFKRLQFPLKLAWALTIHKVQGRTEQNIVVSCKGQFKPGMFYTAISRPCTLNGLHIVGNLKEEHIQANKSSLKEMSRLRRERTIQLPSSDVVNQNAEDHFKFNFINASSLPAHFECMKNDSKFFNTDVMSIAETWLRGG